MGVVVESEARPKERYKHFGAYKISNKLKLSHNTLFNFYTTRIRSKHVLIHENFIIRLVVGFKSKVTER